MAINIAIEQTPAAPLKRPGSTQPSSKRRKQNNDGASSVHLSRSHPLGLKPLGNAFISTTDARPGGLGLFNSLSDELLLDILGLIDSPRDLTCLSQVSKAFYVFARTESLWRDLFLERAKRRLETWAGSWRETYAVQLCGAHDVTQERVRPTRVSDLFSDVLFQPFHCALAPLSSYLPPTSGASVPIPRITSSSYTTAKFFEEFARPNLPVIIEGETNDWPCRTWTLDDLRRRWPDRVFQAEAIRTKLGPYTAYARSCGAHTALGRGVAVPLLPSPSLLGPTTSTSAASTTEVPPNPFNPSSVPDECPYYLFDADFASDPIASGEWRVPELLRTGPGGTQVEADLFSLLGDKRPDWRWLIAGPERSGSGVSAAVWGEMYRK